MNILIPMAGLGLRFKQQGYKLPKPLIDVAGISMIERCVKSLNLKGQYIFMIRKYDNPDHYEALKSTLQTMVKDPIIVEVDRLTEGAACTCLLAKQFINNEEPLISANCDQIMNWNSNDFFRFISNKNADGCVVTYDCASPKNSYIELDENGHGLRLTEKDPISRFSLTGIHYWKRGSLFVKSAEQMIEKNIRVNNEFYVAPTYNQMIQEDKIIVNYHIENSQFYPVGTPEDLQSYILGIDNK